MCKFWKPRVKEKSRRPSVVEPARGPGAAFIGIFCVMGIYREWKYLDTNIPNILIWKIGFQIFSSFCLSEQYGKFSNKLENLENSGVDNNVT